MHSFNKSERRVQGNVCLQQFWCGEKHPLTGTERDWWQFFSYGVSSDNKAAFVIPECEGRNVCEPSSEKDSAKCRKLHVSVAEKVTLLVSDCMFCHNPHPECFLIVCLRRRGWERQYSRKRVSRLVWHLYPSLSATKPYVHRALANRSFRLSGNVPTCFVRFKFLHGGHSCLTLRNYKPPIHCQARMWSLQTMTH